MVKAVGVSGGGRRGSNCVPVVVVVKKEGSSEVGHQSQILTELAMELFE
jgi:hypothetical protein